MHFIKDVIIIIVSVIVAVLIIHLGFVDWMLGVFASPYAASFIAGIFFTSLLTISPASVVLAELGTRAAPLEVAFFGALGAMVGDILLFYFVKDKISADVGVLIKKGLRHYHLDQLHSRYARWVLPTLGAFVIASPLPDELGIMLLGASKMKTRYIIPVSFVMNLIGILLVIAIGEISIRF
jgi:hypothetical protein